MKQRRNFYVRWNSINNPKGTSWQWSMNWRVTIWKWRNTRSVDRCSFRHRWDGLGCIERAVRESSGEDWPLRWFLRRSDSDWITYRLHLSSRRWMSQCRWTSQSCKKRRFTLSGDRSRVLFVKCLDLQEFVYGPKDPRTCQTRQTVEILKK